MQKLWYPLQLGVCNDLSQNILWDGSGQILEIDMLLYPIWLTGNHKNIFNDARVPWSEYRYYDPRTVGLDFDGMVADIKVMLSLGLWHWSLHHTSPVTLFFFRNNKDVPIWMKKKKTFILSFGIYANHLRSIFHFSQILMPLTSCCKLSLLLPLCKIHPNIFSNIQYLMAGTFEHCFLCLLL